MGFLQLLVQWTCMTYANPPNLDEFLSSVYCLIQAEVEVKEVHKQLKRNMDEMENYKLLKYVFIHCNIKLPET